jgi:hypothetical protein
MGNPEKTTVGDKQYKIFVYLCAIISNNFVTIFRTYFADVKRYCLALSKSGEILTTRVQPA